jgi:hypothetical protein
MMVNQDIENIAACMRTIRAEYTLAARPKTHPLDPRNLPTEGLKLKTYTFRHPEVWYKKLFAALCSGYGITAFQQPGDPPSVNHIETSEQFYLQVLWPAFRDHQNVVTQQLQQLMDVIVEDGPWKHDIQIGD